MRKVVLALLFLAFAATPALADYKTGLAAYKQRDYATALRVWTEAWNNGSRTSAYGIGLIHHKGLGVPKNVSLAIEWYVKAAEKNLAVAQYRLGQVYRTGEDVEPDYKKAHDWYLKAANQNYARAQGRLGHLYRLGRGVEKDYAKSLEWYGKGAAQKYAYAQHGMGLMYENGLGVAKNAKTAAEWYELAAAQGFKRAQSDLDRLRAAAFETAAKDAKRSTSKRRSSSRGGTGLTSVLKASRLDRKKDSGRSDSSSTQSLENLFLPLPPAWKEVDLVPPGFVKYEPNAGPQIDLEHEHTAFIPDGSNADNWTELIMIEQVRWFGGFSPFGLADTILKLVRQGCEQGQTIEIASGTVEGNLVAIGGHGCFQTKVREDGTGGDSGFVYLVKVIEGRQRFYRVHRYWRGSAFDGSSASTWNHIVDAWNPWFEAVTAYSSTRPKAFAGGPAFGWHDAQRLHKGSGSGK